MFFLLKCTIKVVKIKIKVAWQLLLFGASFCPSSNVLSPHKLLTPISFPCHFWPFWESEQPLDYIVVLAFSEYFRILSECFQKAMIHAFPNINEILVRFSTVAGDFRGSSEGLLTWYRRRVFGSFSNNHITHFFRHKCRYLHVWTEDLFWKDEMILGALSWKVTFIEWLRQMTEISFVFVLTTWNF